MCARMYPGMAPSTKGSARYSKEGFEEAVGTNHLGHFLLANLLFKVRAGAAMNACACFQQNLEYV